MAEDTEGQKKAKAMLAHLMTPQGMADFRAESERALKEYRRNKAKLKKK